MGKIIHYFFAISFIIQVSIGTEGRRGTISKPMQHGTSCEPKGSVEHMTVEQHTTETQSTSYRFKCTCSGMWSTSWNCVVVSASTNPPFSGSGEGLSGSSKGNPKRSSSSQNQNQNPNKPQIKKKESKPKGFSNVGSSSKAPKFPPLHETSCKSKERGTCKLVTVEEPGIGSKKISITYKCICMYYTLKWNCPTADSDRGRGGHGRPQCPI